MGIKVVTAGESHGRMLMAIVEGVPAGLMLDRRAIDRDLTRRQGGYGRGGRQRIETDRVQVVAGVRGGRTIGSPIGLLIVNRDAENWTDLMSPEAAPTEKLTRPRPGHADLAGAQKVGTDDVRDILERASARETAARVAAGAVCRVLLDALGVSVHSYVSRIGDAALAQALDPDEVDWEAVEASAVRCPDADASSRMMQAIDVAREIGDTLGGTIEIVAQGLLPGLGGYAQAEDRLDGRIAQALASIPAIKAVGFGLGTAYASRKGSETHDEIVADEGGGAPRRRTNRAGGIEGGMTNGEALLVSATMKPLPTLSKPLRTVDLATGEAAWAATERSDVCAVPAASVVCEAELCRVLADACLDKFGGDAVVDVIAARRSYARRIGWGE